MENEEADLDRLQSAYKAAVEEWIAAIREEEALASVNHSVAEIDKWEQAHFREEEVRDKAIQELFAHPRKPGREQDTHDLLEQFTAIADELDDNLDDYGPHHRDIRKALPKLVEATERWSSNLKTPPDNETYNLAHATPKITMPVLAMGGEDSFGTGVATSFDNVATDVLLRSPLEELTISEGLPAHDAARFAVRGDKGLD